MKNKSSCISCLGRHSKLDLASSTHIVTKHNNQSGRSRIKYGMTPNCMGFTLIELLVVVLVIGILASVALPQYQKAVEKSRIAEALTLVRSIVQANQAHYMATGEYTKHLDELDIDIPGEDVTFDGMRRRNTNNFQFGARASGQADSIALANRLPNNSSYALVAFSDGTLCCYKYAARGLQLCRQLSQGTVTTAHQTPGGTKCYVVRF